MEYKPLIYSKLPKGKLCQIRGCICERANGKHVCNKHHYRQKLNANPHRIYYTALKGNAKRRQIPFNLTLQEFITFCIETGYLSLKGREYYSYSIDRIDQNKGYEYSNLQILSNEENIQKYWLYYADINSQITANHSAMQAH